jgi:hypothetical protein
MPHLLTQQVANEKFWCADFQMDNVNCPDYIQAALRVRFAEKFSKKKTERFLSIGLT